jgi:hypothetical protein
MPQSHIRELRSVRPEVHAQRVDVGRSQEVASWRECQTCGNRGCAEGVNKTTGGDVECADNRVEGGGDEPSRVGREDLEKCVQSVDFSDVQLVLVWRAATHRIENTTLEPP